MKPQAFKLLEHRDDRFLVREIGPRSADGRRIRVRETALFRDQSDAWDAANRGQWDSALWFPCNIRR